MNLFLKSLLICSALSTGLLCAEPLTIGDQGYFFVGGEYSKNAQGQQIRSNQMFVQFQKPAVQKYPYPLVMWHGGGITGTNFMLYFDFSAKTAQISVVGVNNWGTSTVRTASLSGDFGTLTVASGPLTNSFLVTVKENSGTNTFLMMSTNGGNNLLVQSGIAGTDDGQPSTGVCNKI